VQPAPTTLLERLLLWHLLQSKVHPLVLQRSPQEAIRATLLGASACARDQCRAIQLLMTPLLRLQQRSTAWLPAGPSLSRRLQPSRAVAGQPPGPGAGVGAAPDLPPSRPPTPLAHLVRAQRLRRAAPDPGGPVSSCATPPQSPPPLRDDRASWQLASLPGLRSRCRMAALFPAHASAPCHGTHRWASEQGRGFLRCDAAADGWFCRVL
jgi:hypothetical protein